MSWKTVAYALDKMPENTYRLHFTVKHQKLKSIPSYVKFLEKDKKRTEELRANTTATITFLGSERRWLVDGELVKFTAKTHFVYSKQIAGRENGIDLHGEPEMFFVIAQRFDEKKANYLSIDIISRKPTSEPMSSEDELIHLADFPIPANGVLNNFWDRENYDRITQPPFSWTETTPDDWGAMDNYTNIYGETIHDFPEVSFENDNVVVRIRDL